MYMYSVCVYIEKRKRWSLSKQLVSAKVCAGFNLQVFLAGSANSSKLSKYHSAGFNLQEKLAGSAF